MKKSYENLLFKLPIFFQNIALSIYGLSLVFERNGGIYRSYLDTTLRHSMFSTKELEVYVNGQIRKTITEAGFHVPYYRSLFKKAKINPNYHISNARDLDIIPLLNKESLRKAPHSFIDERFNKKKLLCIHTTGTTGTPLKIYCDRNSRRINYAYYNSFLMNHMIDPKGTRATLGGRIVVSPSQQSPPFWRYSFFQKNLLFSSYHLTEKNIPYYINKLIQFKPDHIDAYPSSLYVIADYALRNNFDLKNTTKGIITSAETLFSWQREIIEKAFSVKITDQYGSAEMCNFIAQCHLGNYHIHNDYALIEFLRDNGETADPGEEAELVCTGFINSVMPLIRYRIGDRGILSDKMCECGSPFPVLEKLLGRTDDFILTPDGRKVGRLSPVLKGFPIKEAIYLQKRIQSMEVHIVKGDGYNSNTEEKVVKELRKRLGNEIKIHCKYLEKIPRGKGGKLRTVISRLDP